MKKTFLLVLSFLLVFIAGCLDGGKTEKKENALKVIASNNNILQGSGNYITLSAYLGDKEIKNALFLVDGQKIEGNTFYSEQLGEYAISTEVEGQVSYPTFVSVIQPSKRSIANGGVNNNDLVKNITLYADVTQIGVGNKVTFSVVCKDASGNLVDNVDYTIGNPFNQMIQVSNNEFLLTEATPKLSNYTFKAYVTAPTGTVESNLVTIKRLTTNTPAKIIVSTSKPNNRIRADGVDYLYIIPYVMDETGAKVEGTVLQYWITDELGNNPIQLTNNIVKSNGSTITTGKYYVYAKTSTLTSNKILIYITNEVVPIYIEMLSVPTSMTADNQNVVTLSAKVKYSDNTEATNPDGVVFMDNGTVLASNTLVTDKLGLHIIKAKIGSIYSVSYRINAVVPLGKAELSLSKTSVLADGYDTVKFISVINDSKGVAVSNERVSYYKLRAGKLPTSDVKADWEEISESFATVVAGTYYFRVAPTRDWNNGKSSVLTLTAYDEIKKLELTIPAYNGNNSLTLNIKPLNQLGLNGIPSTTLPTYLKKDIAGNDLYLRIYKDSTLIKNINLNTDAVTIASNNIVVPFTTNLTTGMPIEEGKTYNFKVTIGLNSATGTINTSIPRRINLTVSSPTDKITDGTPLVLADNKASVKFTTSVVNDKGVTITSSQGAPAVSVYYKYFGTVSNKTQALPLITEVTTATNDFVTTTNGWIKVPVAGLFSTTRAGVYGFVAKTDTVQGSVSFVSSLHTSATTIDKNKIFFATFFNKPVKIELSPDLDTNGIIKDTNGKLIKMYNIYNQLIKFDPSIAYPIPTNNILKIKAIIKDQNGQNFNTTNMFSYDVLKTSAQPVQLFNGTALDSNVFTYASGVYTNNFESKLPSAIKLVAKLKVGTTTISSNTIAFTSLAKVGKVGVKTDKPLLNDLFVKLIANNIDKVSLTPTLFLEDKTSGSLVYAPVKGNVLLVTNNSVSEISYKINKDTDVLSKIRYTINECGTATTTSDMNFAGIADATVNLPPSLETNIFMTKEFTGINTLYKVKINSDLTDLGIVSGTTITDHVKVFLINKISKVFLKADKTEVFPIDSANEATNNTSDDINFETIFYMDKGAGDLRPVNLATLLNNKAFATVKTSVIPLINGGQLTDTDVNSWFSTIIHKDTINQVFGYKFEPTNQNFTNSYTFSLKFINNPDTSDGSEPISNIVSFKGLDSIPTSITVTTPSFFTVGKNFPVNVFTTRAPIANGVSKIAFKFMVSGVTTGYASGLKVYDQNNKDITGDLDIKKNVYLIKLSDNSITELSTTASHTDFNYEYAFTSTDPKELYQIKVISYHNSYPNNKVEALSPIFQFAKQVTNKYEINLDKDILSADGEDKITFTSKFYDAEDVEIIDLDRVITYKSNLVSTPSDTRFLLSNEYKTKTQGAYQVRVSAFGPDNITTTNAILAPVKTFNAVQVIDEIQVTAPTYAGTTGGSVKINVIAYDKIGNPILLDNYVSKNGTSIIGQNLFTNGMLKLFNGVTSVSPSVYLTSIVKNPDNSYSFNSEAITKETLYTIAIDDPNNNLKRKVSNSVEILNEIAPTSPTSSSIQFSVDRTALPTAIFGLGGLREAFNNTDPIETYHTYDIFDYEKPEYDTGSFTIGYNVIGTSNAPDVKIFKGATDISSGFNIIKDTNTKKITIKLATPADAVTNRNIKLTQINNIFGLTLGTTTKLSTITSTFTSAEKTSTLTIKLLNNGTIVDSVDITAKIPKYKKYEITGFPRTTTSYDPLIAEPILGINDLLSGALVLKYVKAYSSVIINGKATRVPVPVTTFNFGSINIFTTDSNLKIDDIRLGGNIDGHYSTNVGSYSIYTSIGSGLVGGGNHARGTQKPIIIKNSATNGTVTIGATSDSFKFTTSSYNYSTVSETKAFVDLTQAQKWYIDNQPMLGQVGLGNIVLP